VEVDSGPIVISVSVTTGKAFHFLNFAVETFGQGVGYPVSGIGYDVVDMSFQTFGGLDHRG
jgi:hypothetical protein